MAAQTINFIYTQEIETAMPGITAEVRFSGLALISDDGDGETVEFLPNLSVSVNGDRWTDYLVPSGNTSDERKFLAKLREAARMAKWQRDNVELKDNSFAASMGRKQ